MSVRNLGDWSPLDLDSDPVYADPDKIDEAQKRYQKISDTLDDAIAKLTKIVDQGSDSLAGQYVEGLKSDASDVKDSLSKASVRYRDVASQIKIYQPHLQEGLDETAGALDDARDAKDAQTKAKAMPDGKKNDDGTLSPDEQQIQDAKDKATNAADDALSAAKNRLNNAMNALNTAGKAFGDAVNCNNYDDGLTDSLKDKIDAVFKEIGYVFGIIGMILGVLAILIPGVDLIVFAGLAAGVVSLVSSAVLYADGDGSLLDVVLGAVGLGVGIAGLGLGALGKGLGLGKLGSDPQGAPKIDFAPGWSGKPPKISWDENGDPVWEGGAGSGDHGWVSGAGNGKVDWPEGPGVGDPVLVPPPPEIPPAFWTQFTGYLGKVWEALSGLSNAKDLSKALLALGFGKIPWLSFTWGGFNSIFNLANLIIAGGEATKWFPDVNPPGYGS